MSSPISNYHVSNDTITVSDWLNDTSVGADARRNRKQVLRLYSTANGKTVEEILEEITTGRVSLYTTARRLVDSMRERELKPSTVFFYRSLLPGFFESVLGEENFKQKVFDRLVPAGEFYVSTTKKSPTPDETRQLLRIATPQYRALVGVEACTGMRIGEAVSRKMSDLEIRPSGIGRIKLQVGQTKARIKRYVFVTREVIEWIRQYHLRLKSPSEWMFPGEKGTHLAETTAWTEMKRLFGLCGMKDTEDEIYSTHSWRLFADSQMSKSGLDRKYIALIVSHKSKLGAESHYKDWDEIERQWIEKCEEKLTWLTDRVEVTVVDPVARKQNELMLSVLEAKGLLTPELLSSINRTKERGKITELTKEEVENLLEDQTDKTGVEEQ
ncbi:MAG TPA: tyrosine-type recombinase/integrase [Candidatus Bathyarchaeia archaeon]|nr:tyrosine-type recombinase/integrase [Candidatus Bathyarchaeia archaeon]